MEYPDDGLIVYVWLPPLVTLVVPEGSILPPAPAVAVIVYVVIRVVVTALDTPFACPDAVAVTVVLSVPLVCAVCAVTVRVEVLLAPGANVTDPGLAVEALKFVLFVSEAARLNVVLVQAVPMSLLVILMV